MLTVLVLLIAGHYGVLSSHGKKALVLLFIRSDCPISNRYAPELQRLYERYSPEGIDFRLVYVEPGITVAAAEQHRREYGYAIPAVVDARHEDVKRGRARVTPEAAVFVDGELVYHGRVDDRYVEIGRERPRALHHDLEDVLVGVVAGKAVTPRETTAIGCVIENLK
jgi:hypothetical protein